MENQKKLLSILIPTYNRYGYLRRLLQYFIEKEITPRHHEIEIVVANNCSQDETSKLFEEFKNVLPDLRWINHSHHVSSAEENVFRSFVNCDGQYIWVLGDDDIPVFENLSQVLEELKSDKHDFLI